jgi:hypothetical protein
MFSPDNFSIRGAAHKGQFDFFEALDNVVPNEDIKEFDLGVGKRLSIDPKERGYFYIFDDISQMTAQAHYDRSGTVVDVLVTRWGGESGEIEQVRKERFTQDAEIAVKKFGVELGLT